ncbi:GUN4 domain-containing protein [Oscillatoria salina]|uniref:GUN4 domain-containing protein n=1 Tax=Oscillatoria salina TaxID=331517 RepID=UPI0013B66DEF|nr:GUN4 domain-containing protein [Oscillatoria salina]MBZ8179596.1 GUN4 domain-containing protein [Oscillatoria salina IIICB1]NET87660.1 GUN4 domain-containing protein [Kamptonema sp. SIO1D9]
MTSSVEKSETRKQLQPMLDYTKLDKLLAESRWREADLETKRLILSARGKHYLMEIEIEDLSEISYDCLEKLDRLWRKYSSDRFGFSRQDQLWQSLGGNKPDANYQTWLNFGKQVGWLDKCWLSWSQLNFSIDAPVGSLPAAWVEEWEYGDLAIALFSRLEVRIGD